MKYSSRSTTPTQGLRVPAFKKMWAEAVIGDVRQAAYSARACWKLTAERAAASMIDRSRRLPGVEFKGAPKATSASMKTHTPLVEDRVGKPSSMASTNLVYEPPPGDRIRSQGYQ